jgi:hypothetical protein
MKTEYFSLGHAKLISIGSENNTVYMCSELNWRSCHRSFISRALHDRRWEVIHIYVEGESEAHSVLFLFLLTHTRLRLHGFSFVRIIAADEFRNLVAYGICRNFTRFALNVLHINHLTERVIEL